MIGSKERSAATLSEGTRASWAAGTPPAGWPGWSRENWYTVETRQSSPVLVADPSDETQPFV